MKEENILLKLKDLLKQARNEKSHYYTSNLLQEAIREILVLRLKITKLITELHSYLPLEEIDDLIENLDDDIQEDVERELKFLDIN